MIPLFIISNKFKDSSSTMRRYLLGGDFLYIEVLGMWCDSYKNMTIKLICLRLYLKVNISLQHCKHINRNVSLCADGLLKLSMVDYKGILNYFAKTF